MNFLLIFMALGLGVALQRLPLPHVQLRQSLSSYVFWVAWPALIFKYMVGLGFEWQQLWLASVGWVYFLVGWLFFILLQRALGFDRKTLGALVLVAGVGNTSFLGLPVITGLYGSSAMADAIIVDMLGTLILLNTLGISLAYFYSGEPARKRDVVARILKFPPVVAFLLTLLMNTLNWQWPSMFAQVWELLAYTLAPVALVVVGMQLKWAAFREFRLPIVYGLLFCLILAPLITLGVYQFVFSGQALAVAVIMAAMASSITASIIASEMGLNPHLCSALVTAGTVLSVVTIPFWYLLLSLN